MKYEEFREKYPELFYDDGYIDISVFHNENGEVVIRERDLRIVFDEKDNIISAKKGELKQHEDGVSYWHWDEVII